MVASNKTSYSLKVSDVGHKITLVASISRKGFMTVTSESQDYLVSPATFSALGTATITGSIQAGKQLRVAAKGWIPGVQFEYQWLVEGFPIEQANFKSYQISNSDLGKQISVKVTAKKAGYLPVNLITSSVSSR